MLEPKSEPKSEPEFLEAVNSDGETLEYSGTFTPKGLPFNGVITLRIERTIDSPEALKIICRERSNSGLETTSTDESDVVKMGEYRREIRFHRGVNTPEELGYWILHLMNNPDANIGFLYQYRDDPEALNQ